MSLASRSLITTWPAPARHVLVLGGIRSGKSALAEALLADSGPVRYLATAAGAPADPAWQARVAAHQARRPAGWITEEIGSDPLRLVACLAAATGDESLLVDDVGGWLTALLAATDGWADPAAADEPAAELVAAVAECPAARLVLVSPEVGLSVIPATEAGRTFADAQGTVNRRLAETCDAVALVVAGQPIWLAGGPNAVWDARPRRPRAAVPAPEPEPAASEGGPTAGEPTTAGQATPTGSEETGFVVPPITAPDEAAAEAAQQRLALLDVPGPGLGELTEVVRFAAAAQGDPDPRPWADVRLLLLRGDHAGGSQAADSPADSARRLEQASHGVGVLAGLARTAGAAITAIACPPAAAIEVGDALSSEAVDAALATGAAIANAAIDSGADLLVLASCGTGRHAAAAAVTALVSGGEPQSLLPRAVDPGGKVDDQAWMDRCVAVRDALYRIRNRPIDPGTVLATVGGGDIAVATGILLAAAARRTPVLLDGPVGAAAALLAREYAVAVSRWLLLADDGGHPTVRRMASTIGLVPVLDLKADLGEGATALLALPLLRSALVVAATIAPGEATETSSDGW